MLAIKDPVKAAAKLARKLTAKEIDDTALAHERTLNILTNIEKFKAEMLPIESLSTEKIDEVHREASRQIKRLTDVEKLRQYATFSVEPLKWRNKDGWPRLAVFSLASPTVKFAVIAQTADWTGRRSWKRHIAPTYPRLISDCYADVLAAMSIKAKALKKSVHLEAQFTSLIPAPIKAKIAEAQPHFKEIFIVAEAPNWKLETVAIPRPQRDPLVVGFDGHNLWLIAAFDATPLERYIQDEWTLEPTTL